MFYEKKLFCLAFVLLFAFATIAEAETVAQMTYIVKMPDVIREGTYTGEVQNGVPHGYGVFVTQNSAGVYWHYLGEWKNGEMSGNGGQYWDHGQSHVGTFESNDMLFGYKHQTTSLNIWVDYRPNEHGCCNFKEYRSDGSVRIEGCANFEDGKYHIVTIYTKEGNVFFSGELGDGFDQNRLYID